MILKRYSTKYVCEENVEVAFTTSMVPPSYLEGVSLFLLHSKNSTFWSMSKLEGLPEMSKNRSMSTLEGLPEMSKNRSMSALEGLTEMSKNSTFWSMFTSYVYARTDFLVNVYARGLALDVKEQVNVGARGPARDVKEQHFLVNVYTVCLCKNSTFWSMSTLQGLPEISKNRSMFALEGLPEMSKNSTFRSMFTPYVYARTVLSPQYFLVNVYTICL